MSQDNSRFDDYSDIVECGHCERWWNNQCDGVSDGAERPCKAFLATRKVSLPEDVERLTDRLDSLSRSVIVFGVVLILLIIRLALHTIWGI